MRNFWLDRKTEKSNKLVFKRKYRWDFSDLKEPESKDSEILPPWNTETYNAVDLDGWECDL